MSGQNIEKEKPVLQGKNIQVPVSSPNVNNNQAACPDFVQRQRATFMSPTDNMFSPCTKKIMSRRGPMGQRQLLTAAFRNQAQKENAQ